MSSKSDAETKICGRCGEEKPHDHFYYHKKHTDGLNSYCKPCTRLASKQWYEANKHRAASRTNEARIKRIYGITEKQYQQMFDNQSGCCAVCSRHQETLKMRLCIDHNHKTGEIRGLLCTNCNHRLIGRHTDGEILRRMADYVEAGTGWFVPEKKKKKRARRKPKPCS